ncbi:oligosaccharyltransferase complex subunit epsilon [Fusarium torreyae]|uniref:Dolichyl-diphosphooligosaccharide--protein glycosyltransferase subunit OST2 n=1 Tax=Fusarium torreyae TaxID=1237075 RepID=A0A9W8VMH6_9HYPO|nr:oligosaccharyltransferase complex subunit epsilon [Fusarium torreyae]
MAPKKNARDITPSAAATTQASTTAAGTVPPQQPKPVAPKTVATKGGDVEWNKAVQDFYNHYNDKTPQRVKLIDAFMAFLVVVGVIQFLYCILAGTFPFNAFLSGFCATVGQFVLTGSLRLQTNEATKSDCPSVSPERAFADYVVCSLILHFFVINFIN